MRRGLIAAGWFVFAQRPTHVQIVKVEKGSAVELVYATGYVDAEHPVSVSARITTPYCAIISSSAMFLLSLP